MIKKIVFIICCDWLSGDLHKHCGHDDDDCDQDDQEYNLYHRWVESSEWLTWYLRKDFGDDDNDCDDDEDDDDQ